MSLRVIKNQQIKRVNSGNPSHIVTLCSRTRVLIKCFIILVRYLVDISLNERTTTDHQDQIQSKPKERILF